MELVIETCATRGLNKKIQVFLLEAAVNDSIFQMQYLTLLCLAVCVVSSAALGLGSPKAFGVQGCFTCFGKPAVGVKVKLYDEDKSQFLEFSSLTLN